MQYPIIMNGDRAEFERELAGTPPKDRPDWPLPSFDAKDWSEAFCKIANGFGFKDANGQEIDQGWMTGWFANALMRGFDEHAKTADDSFAMDRHIEALERVKLLESIVRRVSNYPAMVARYKRGELSWANSINDLERDINAAMPGLFENRLPD